MLISTEALRGELEWVNRFIEKKATIPILANVLFEVDGPHLDLTATDLEVAGKAALVIERARVKKEQWNCAAPVRKLIQYLAKVDEPEVELSTTDNKLIVKHGTSITRIAGMSKESYPELPASPQPEITLSGLPLALERTLFAISPQESRFTLNSAMLEVEADGKAQVIATDGNRLSIAPLKAKTAQKASALIPKKALAEAARLEGDCTFTTSRDHVWFSWGQRSITSRRLTGNFPDYNRTLPKETIGHVFLPVATTLKTLNRVAIYADERSHAVRFKIGDGKLTISSSSIELGEAEGTVPVQTGGGSLPMEAGYNANYVADFLSRTEFANVAFCYNNAKTAAVFATSDGWKYVLMPMRI
jgi:DNA polymerase-3 subunit beta